MSDIPNDMPTRVAVLEEIARGTKAALDRIERRMDEGFHASERRMDGIERRMDDGFRTMERRMDDGFREHRSDFRWLLGVMIGWGVALLGVTAHGFHWI
jgi:hypothetical protein